MAKSSAAPAKKTGGVAPRKRLTNIRPGGKTLEKLTPVAPDAPVTKAPKEVDYEVFFQSFILTNLFSHGRKVLHYLRRWRQHANLRYLWPLRLYGMYPRHQKACSGRSNGVHVRDLLLGR